MDNLGPVRRDGRAGDLRSRRGAIYRRALGLGRCLSPYAGQGSDKSGNTRNISRVLVFKLGGKTVLPPLPAEPELLIPPLPDTASAETVAAGEAFSTAFAAFATVKPRWAEEWFPICAPLRSLRWMLVQHCPRWRVKAGRYGAVRADAGSCAGLRYSRLCHPSRECPRCTERRKIRSQAGCQSWRGYRGTRHRGRRSSLRAMSRLYRRVGRQRRFSAAHGTAGLLSLRQLLDFRSGARANAIMSPIARALSPEDAADVAAISQARSHRFRLLLLQILTS